MKTSPRSLSRFSTYLTEQLRSVVTAYAATVLGIGVTLMLPWPLKFIIDSVLTDQGGLSILAPLGNGQQLLVLAASIGVLATAAALVQSTEKVMHARVRERFNYRLRDDLMQTVHRLSREMRQSEMSGELTMRLVSDTQRVSRLFCKTIPIAAKHMLTAIATLGSIIVISRPIGFAALVVAAVLTALVVSFGPRLARVAAARRGLEGRVSAHTQETINGIEHIQAMALEEQSRNEYLKAAGASLKAGVDEVRMAVRLERNSQIIAGLSLALVAGIGGIAVINGAMLLGELTVCLSYIALLLKPIEKINELAISIGRGVARANRVSDLFAADTTPDSRTGTVLTERVDRIDCVNLGFHYPDSDDPILSGLNHSFRRGECTSIAGPSGCGKSTLLRLILGLQSPTSGALQVNGKNYGDLQRGSLRTQFAVLLQDAHLFAGSIRDIVTEANPIASDSAIWDVLNDVYLLQDIEALPLGLETPIDEAGARFSGGQKARLLLARALLSERPVLLLDEPFANLDDDSRRIILACLAEAKKHRILIIVTHERALLGLADHVLTAGDFRGAQEPASGDKSETLPRLSESGDLEVFA